jgi:integrase
MSAKIVQLRKDETDRNATSGRLPNNVYRIREHLTEAETDKLLAAL